MLSRRIFVATPLILLLTVSTAGRAGEPNRLAALAARQDLCDRVYIAMADGHISPAERYAIFLQAKTLLKPDEYQSFKRAVDRLSPPKHAAVQRSVRVVQQKTQAATPSDTAPLPQPSLALTVPAGATQPDGMASTDDAR
jgi:hypothetical protein